MSKTALKKELATLDHEQIVELVLTAYSYNKAVKEYFDFFCNPDVDKLYEKYINAIAKELSRGKYRRCTARISRIKRALRDFESFNPGAEIVCDLRLEAIKMLVELYAYRELAKPLVEGTVAIVNDTIKFADKNFISDTTINRISKILDTDTRGNVNFRNYIRKNIVI